MIMPVDRDVWDKMTREEKVKAMEQYYSPGAAEYVTAVLLGEIIPETPLQ
jgi:hypothetical protein